MAVKSQVGPHPRDSSSLMIILFIIKIIPHLLFPTAHGTSVTSPNYIMPVRVCVSMLTQYGTSSSFNGASGTLLAIGHSLTYTAIGTNPRLQETQEWFPCQILSPQPLFMSRNGPAGRPIVPL